MADPIDELAAAVSRLNPQEHGFSHIDLDRPAQGRGRLDGWLLSVKDLTDVSGMPTTMGSIHRTYTPLRSDPLVAELESQGARIVGKSAVPELGLMVDTEPTGMPAVDNPKWNGRTPGGSSGGAAVQVARGLLRAAHASDAGGSIRVPAAACGVVGFKPAGTSLSASGFITRSVADAAFLHGLTPRVPRATVGVLAEPLFGPDAGNRDAVAPEMLDALAHARRLLECAGIETVEVTPWSDAQQTFEAFTRLFSSAFVDIDIPAPSAGSYVEWVRDLGRSFTQQERTEAVAHALELPALLAREWPVDALLTPMLASAPPPHGFFRGFPHPHNFSEQTRWSPWGSLFNVARLPAISVPLGDVSVQLGSVRLSEAELLGLARQLHD